MSLVLFPTISKTMKSGLKSLGGYMTKSKAEWILPLKRTIVTPDPSRVSLSLK